MVVAEIRSQGSLEVAGVQDDAVVQTFPSNRANQTLGVWNLPSTFRCCQNLLDAQRLDSRLNLSTVPAVAIADEILSSVSVCERFYDLLCGPSAGRMLGHIEMQHLATIVFQYHQNKQHPHGNGRHGKKIDRYHLPDMVVQEGLPRLVGRMPEPAQDARDSAFGDA